MVQIRFAENLKRLRRANSMTQKMLAELLKVDQRTISAWENSVSEPSYSTLAHICEVFDEDFNDILT